MATAYKIHNMSRAIETRSLRAASSAVRAPKKLLLGGGTVRVLRGRPATVTEAALRRMQPELLKREERGELKVTDIHDRRVDISTLKPMEDAPVDPPKPAPKLDSAADDNKYPIGEGQPQHPGGAALTDKLDVPAVITDNIPEGNEEPEPVSEPSPETAPVPATEESLASVVQAIYDSGTSKSLKAQAAEMGLSTEGNKTDVATRLAEAGYSPEE